MDQRGVDKWSGTKRDDNVNYVVAGEKLGLGLGVGEGV